MLQILALPVTGCVTPCKAHTFFECWVSLLLNRYIRKSTFIQEFGGVLVRIISAQEILALMTQEKERQQEEEEGEFLKALDT